MCNNPPRRTLPRPSRWCPQTIRAWRIHQVTVRTCIAASVCKSCQLPLGLALRLSVQMPASGGCWCASAAESAGPMWFTLHKILQLQAMLYKLCGSAMQAV